MWSRSVLTSSERSSSSSAMPASWRARTDSGSMAITRKTTKLSSVARVAAPSTPSFASSSRCPSNARLEIRSATVKPMPATVPPPTIVGQLNDRWRPPTRDASHVAATIPSGFPTTYPKTIPSVMGDATASPSRSASISMPAFASAKRGTITKLVQGWSRYCSRSLGETADITPSCAERASSGVGCSRNERVSSVTRSRSERAGGYALVPSPTKSPAMTGSTPDSNNATHTAVPSRTAAGTRQVTGAWRSASSPAKHAAATPSGMRLTPSL